MSLAIVHEWLNVYGGSERLLAEIISLFPQTKIHALIHNRENLSGSPLEGYDVKTSFLQKIPQVEHLYRGLLPIMPLAIENLNVQQYPVVLSISHAVAHGVKTTKEQTHISYICTPMRYAWHLENDYLHLHHLDKPLVGAAAHLTLGLLRRWDKSVAARADHLLAISHWTAERIKEAWGRDSKVIYPPVDIERFVPAREREDFYLYVARLVPYKMTAEIIQAFNQLKLPLFIIGGGPELPHLKKLAKENIKLLGHQPDQVVTDLMSRAKAFVYMAVEDFGIAMVEAQAGGCPVIAYFRGGAREILRDGETGLLYREQTARSLIDTVCEFERRAASFSPQTAQENAARFSKERFCKEFTGFLEPFIKS
jgi:glycosyltransferase involved in cell wall biosynthesis